MAAPASDSSATDAPAEPAARRDAAPPSAAGARRPAWLAWLCGLLLAAVLARLGSVSAAQLRAPFDLVYESPNLATIELLRAGGDPYSPATYDDVPFILTVYTPLYHLLVAALPAARDNPFFTGRLVALLCMLGSAALLFALPRRATAWSALGAAAFLALWPVTSNAAFLKNDALALLCAGGAVVLVTRGTARSAAQGAASPLVHAWLPALLCVLGAASKQSYVAAPVACALHLLLADRRRGLHFAAALALFGGLFALLVTAAWGSGFWFCTVTGMRHPMSLDTARAVLAGLARQPLPWVLLGATALSVGVRLLRQPRRLLTDSPLPLYVLCTALVFALTIGKLGASTNYVFEVALAAALWLATFGPAARPRLAATLGGALLLVTAADLALAERLDVSFVDEAISARRVALAGDLRARCARLAGPDAVVLDAFGFLHTFELQREGFLSDPWVYSVLWQQGTLKPAPLVAALKRGAADLVLLPAALDPRQPLAGPPGRVVAAVVNHYRLAETADGYAFYVRRGR